MSNQPVIRSRREAKLYAIAVVAGFVMVPIAVFAAFALASAGATGGFVFCLALAALIGFIAARYSRHLTAYTRHEKETQ